MKRFLNIRDATKELTMLRSLKTYRRPFEVLGTYRLIDDGVRPEATVVVNSDNETIHEAATGVGPVDALANALKKSLASIFPVIEGIKLVDFSSRIYDSRWGTAAKVEVSIIFTDGTEIWSVSAFSENINMASFLALLDGFEYAIVAKKSDPPPDAQPAAQA